MVQVLALEINDRAVMDRTAAPAPKNRGRRSARSNLEDCRDLLEDAPRVMAFNSDDTICAIATAPGGAGRGMVRVSGPAAIAIAAQVFKPIDWQSVQAIRHATALLGRACIEIDATPRDLRC